MIPGIVSARIVIAATPTLFNHWIATLGGSSAEIGYGIAIDASGNCYAAGSAASQGSGSTDVLLTKYNEFGIIQWQRLLGGSAVEVARGIAIDSSGNICVVGYTSSQGPASNNVLIAKYNSAGAIQWQRSLGGGSSDLGLSIGTDSSDNIYVSGSTASQGAGSDDLLLTKYNSSGTIQWQRSLGGSGQELGYAISVNASGDSYVVGTTTSQGTGGELLLTKYNTSGTIQWQRRLGGSSSEAGYAIALDSSGDIYVTGHTTSQGAGSNDALIAKYNSSGTIQWQRSLGGAGTEFGTGIAIDSSGGVYVVGTTTSQGAGGVDFLLTKYDTSGAIQWQRSIGNAADSLGQGVAVNNSGDVYVTGSMSISGQDELVIIKLPDDGTLTGTYAGITYAATTLTDAARTLTDAATTLTDAARTLTAGTTTLTDAASTLTSSITGVY